MERRVSVKGGRGILGLDIVILLLSSFLVGMTPARFM